MKRWIQQNLPFSFHARWRSDKESTNKTQQNPVSLLLSHQLDFVFQGYAISYVQWRLWNKTYIMVLPLHKCYVLCCFAFKQLMLVSELRMDIVQHGKSYNKTLVKSIIAASSQYHDKQMETGCGIWRVPNIISSTNMLNNNAALLL